VGPTGEATQVQVAESSGRALLDAAATDCVVREAAPFPPVPDCLLVDVHFARRP
jgi:TonB family protein